MRNAIPIRILFFLALIPGWQLLQAQEVVARLELLSDTTALGRPFVLRLEVTHPADVMIFTPRGKKDFFPFDLIDMEPERTRTHNDVSVDAVTYHLSTFLLGENQVLTLPIGYRRPESDDLEMIEVQSEPIRLMERIPREMAALSYREHTELSELKDPPNFALLFLYTLIGFALILFAGLWLQGPIERYLRMRKVQAEWNRVERKIQQLQESKADQASRLDQLNRIWKIYLDPKGNHALLSLTTTELMPIIRDIPEIVSREQETLIQASRSVDEVLYAGKVLSDDQLYQIAQRVNDLLLGLYKRRREKVALRQNYSRQFSRRIRKLWQAPQTEKTSWRGGY